MLLTCASGGPWEVYKTCLIPCEELLKETRCLSLNLMQMTSSLRSFGYDVYVVQVHSLSLIDLAPVF